LSNTADFHAQADDVFGRIATRYDLLCDLFSLGIDIHTMEKDEILNLPLPDLTIFSTIVLYIPSVCKIYSTKNISCSKQVE